MGIKEKNNIGLDKIPGNKIENDLNQLLADYQVLYMNVRGFHWNITGENFFDLHQQFATLYSDLLIKIDEIAERILAFGGVPLHSYEKYINHSNIQSVENLRNGQAIVQSIISGIMRILTLQRKIAFNAKEIDDDGTYNMISTYIKEQEKIVWMYNSYLGK